MKLIRGLINIQDEHKGCVVSIGNFDGVHLGHQSILRRMREQAAELNARTMVICFEPQPQEYFQSNTPKARLMTLRDKLLALKNQGIDFVLCLRFDQTFSNISAQDFIEKILIQKCRISGLLVGKDFRFGYQREGTIEYLQDQLHKRNICFEALARLTLASSGLSISSSEIRSAIDQGNFHLAKQMLGSDYAISGCVIHGDKRGRSIGWPTANILLRRRRSPVSGVYIVSVTGLGGKAFPGVCNVGKRPTVDGTREILEVHLFQFQSMIYGQQVRVIFHEKIRNEMRFNGIEELISQIEKDAQIAQEFFKNQNGVIESHE